STAPSARGRKKLYNESDLNVIVREYVTAQNKAIKPTTAQLICNHIEGVVGKCYNVRTMRVWLNDMGFRHLRGQQRHYLAETTGNVAFQATYLQTRLSNRDPRNHPIQPEVFLDESCCNVNHVTGKTWLNEDKIRISKSDIDFEPSWFIPQLLELVKAHKSKLNYVSHRIANEQGHYLLDTPPRVLRIERKYMTELEECELVDEEKLSVGDEDDAE
ncbi:hypothetical protein JG687_00003122, partial [Phytophthora cactorum]